MHTCTAHINRSKQILITGKQICSAAWKYENLCNGNNFMGVLLVTVHTSHCSTLISMMSLLSAGLLYLQKKKSIN